MPRFIGLFAVAALSATPIAGPGAQTASAQLAVYDPANHVQNIVQAIRALQQINQQVQQLTHEIEMLENMARNLETLPVDVAEAIILDRIRRIHDLMEDAEGIGYGVEETERDYDGLYPENYGETPPENAVLVAEARARWRQSRSAYRDTLVTLGAALENNQTDAAAISHLVSQSQSAVGGLQAAQAGNQLQALQAEQLMQIEAIMAAHYRAEALDRARELTEAERGRARTRAFLGLAD
jgi:type IV secretion system protein TrbJ